MAVVHFEHLAEISNGALAVTDSVLAGLAETCHRNGNEGAAEVLRAPRQALLAEAHRRALQAPPRDVFVAVPALAEMQEEDLGRLTRALARTAQGWLDRGFAGALVVQAVFLAVEEERISRGYESHVRVNADAGEAEQFELAELERLFAVDDPRENR